jgi:WS/DGAT/MGAT family acyltransferase
MTGNRPIGAVDTIWLNMDRPNNLMIIDAIQWFDAPVDWDRLTVVLEDRLVGRFPVFRQRPVDPALHVGLPHWEDDTDFDLNRHIIRATLPEPGDDAALQRYIEEQVHRPFDRMHPLWEYHYIDGYGAGAALLSRFHHALADGAALTEVLLSTTDATPDGDLHRRRKPRPIGGHAGQTARLGDQHDPHDRHTTSGGLLGGAVSWAAGAAGLMAKNAFQLISEVPHLASELPHLASGLPNLADPHRLMDALSLTQQTGQIAATLLLGSNPASPLGGTPGRTKRVAWGHARDLTEIKRVGRLSGATVNDVLVTAISSAVSRYQVDRGAEPVDLTTMVPVNLRQPGEPLPRELGNKFALVFLQMASGQWAPLERLAVTKQRMDWIKHSPEAVITFGLIQAIGRTNPDVERVLVNFFSSKAIGVTTNVMGPPKQRYMAGTPLGGVLGWVPGSGDQTLGISILTYNQTVRVGFKTDAGIIPDPEKLVHAFDEAIDELLTIIHH